MPLELIVGPPNSGRTGAILDRFTAALGAAPLLVVPTSDDVDRFERELCERPGSGIGGSVTSFPGLFGEVARACGAGTRDSVSRMQRVWLCRAAARESRGLRILARSSRSEGFAPALEGMISELQAAGLDAASFGELVAGLDGPSDGAGAFAYEAELVSLFAAYERRRDALGLGDEHTFAREATAALRSEPQRWGGRPVFLYGFDDLTREQIELIDALAGAAPVVAALGWEPRAALDARAELLADLREELGGEIVAELEPDSSHTGSATLFHLERNLFEPAAPAVEPDGALRLLVSAGERGEAELIGRRIARLIADGTEPDRIAVAVRSPDRQAPLLARVLGSLGVPVAAEARVELARTATGSTLLRMLALAAGADGTDGPGGAGAPGALGDPGAPGIADLLAFLRGPARAPASSVDWFEREVARGRIEDVEEAIRLWEERAGKPIWGLSALRDDGAGPARHAEVVAELASDIAEYPHRRSGVVPAGEAALELRAAAEVRRACAEAAALRPDAPAAAELAELLRLVRVPLWRGPTEGRVRILSPYRLRATRVFDLFVAGLADGSFPSPGGSDPLLSDERRRELGIRARRDPTAEERYLFYACVSRPERSLCLSWPASDESGATIARSPFVDEVRDLLSPPPDPADGPAEDPVEVSISDVAGLGEIAVAPELASSPRDLRRALAALGAEEAGRRLAGLGLDAEVAQAAADAVASARARAARSRAPGPLRNELVLRLLGERDVFGASTLEGYDTCPYVWFADHELRPARIEPDPEPLETGGIVHAALERLYRDPPAGRRPVPETLGAWVEAGRSRLREAARERDWDTAAASARINLSRLDAVLERFLRRDAETGGPMEPQRDLLEAAFGDGPDDDFPAASIGSFRLHGRIDRVDVSDDGKALIRDYKLSSKVVAAKKLIAEGKLQLPLYMAAVRGMGLDPIGGLYHPLAATGDDRPRGLLAADEKNALIPGETRDAVGTDFLDDETFDGIVAEGIERAEEIVAGIRAGRIARDPRGGSCPRWCRFASVCRMERGIVDPDEEEEEEAVA